MPSANIVLVELPGFAGIGRRSSALRQRLMSRRTNGAGRLFERKSNGQFGLRTSDTPN